MQTLVVYLGAVFWVITTAQGQMCAAEAETSNLCKKLTTTRDWTNAPFRCVFFTGTLLDVNCVGVNHENFIECIHSEVNCTKPMPANFPHECNCVSFRNPQFQQITTDRPDRNEFEETEFLQNSIILRALNPVSRTNAVPTPSTRPKPPPSRTVKVQAGVFIENTEEGISVKFILTIVIPAVTSSSILGCIICLIKRCRNRRQTDPNSSVIPLNQSTSLQTNNSPIRSAGPSASNANVPSVQSSHDNTYETIAQVHASEDEEQRQANDPDVIEPYPDASPHAHGFDNQLYEKVNSSVKKPKPKKKTPLKVTKGRLKKIQDQLRIKSKKKPDPAPSVHQMGTRRKESIKAHVTRLQAAQNKMKK